MPLDQEGSVLQHPMPLHQEGELLQHPMPLDQEGERSTASHGLRGVKLKHPMLERLELDAER